MNRIRRVPIFALAVAGSLGVTGTAQAFQIPVDNPDFDIRWDNTIRYNTGWRVASRDDGLANNPGNDQANYLFDRGDMVTNRLDLFSELDLTYQRRMGVRLSAAAWYDERYDRRVANHPALAGQSTYIDNRFSNYIKRYYEGPSGEILDAFVWGNFLLGDTDLAVRLGRHAVLWGEAVFPTASGNSVAFSQAPSDGLKATISPGATAKETVLPLNQVTGTWQITPRVSISGLYTFEWRESRIPEGGTFLGVNDGVLRGPDFLAPGIPWGERHEGDRGDWGVNVRWRPSFLGEPDLGFYYRKFDDMNPSWATQLARTPGGALQAHTVHARDIEVLGASFATNVGSSAVSSELSYRKNTPLVSASPIFASQADLEGALGNTWHFLINSTTAFNKSQFFDGAVLLMELTHQRLDRVTQNPTHFRSANTQPGACGEHTIVRGCATRDATHFAVLFSPKWQQVMPGVDLSLPLVFQRGLKGNAPTGGINEGGQVFRVGLVADYQARHNFELAYTNYSGKSAHLGQASAAGPFRTTNGALATYEDRDLVTFTYKTTF